jgi:hypothetical protein
MDVMKQVAALKSKHKKVGRKRRVAVLFPDLSEPNAPVLSNSMVGKGGFRRDPLAHRWKRGREESIATIREIEAKKTRIVSLVNKQGYSYITPESDPHTFGRK